ncbi:hypothetical protein [Thalassospira sp. TSL5-1]|uniref:hypothetical protein n=1 Tax=Thalassospira sp. TSL5-1 TaxID=1544451 RepID=UPI000939A1F3|nr:hypothetical protein [Thalassospira sp. TSL5-1]OKH89449.1 hypothetical protein LF95_05580 [Thalassospira sp. TSL5-1]
MTYRGILRCAVPLAGLLALFACAPMTPPAQPSATNASGIVTPWSWNAPAPEAANATPPARQDEQPSSSAARNMASPQQPMRPEPGTMMPNPNGTAIPYQGAATALSPTQQTELDEARIALGILDRMANRCLTEADAAACTTFQVNWPNLSRQLRQSLGVISGTDFTDPIVPQTANDFSQYSSPVGNVPRRASSTEPSMEKEIPLIPGN